MSRVVPFAALAACSACSSAHRGLHLLSCILLCMSCRVSRASARALVHACSVALTGCAIRPAVLTEEPFAMLSGERKRKPRPHALWLYTRFCKLLISSCSYQPGSRCCPCRASSADCPWCHPSARPLWRSTPVSVWVFGIGPALSQVGHLKVEARSERHGLQDVVGRGDCFLLRLLEAACRGKIVSIIFEAWLG